MALGMTSSAWIRALVWALAAGVGFGLHALSQQHELPAKHVQVLALILLFALLHGIAELLAVRDLSNRPRWGFRADGVIRDAALRLVLLHAMGALVYARSHPVSTLQFITFSLLTCFYVGAIYEIFRSFRRPQ